MNAGRALRFSPMLEELRRELGRDAARIRYLLSKNPAMAYSAIVETGRRVGSKYGVQLIVNFPHEGKIERFDMYGRRDLSIIVDRRRRRFPVPRETVKAKALEMFGDAAVEDAYMYEDREGARVRTRGGKIDILPHSLHVWTEFDETVTGYCDWLAENVYGRADGQRE